MINRNIKKLKLEINKALIRNYNYSSCDKFISDILHKVYFKVTNDFILLKKNTKELVNNSIIWCIINNSYHVMIMLEYIIYHTYGIKNGIQVDTINSLTENNIISKNKYFYDLNNLS